MDFTKSSIEPLINIIVTHHRFESIHPFLDGNGRTGRILIVTQLMYYGYLDEPVLYLSRYINNTKSDYYMHLKEAKCNGYDEMKQLVMYYLVAIESTSKSSTKLIKEISKLIEQMKIKLLTVQFNRNSDNRLIDLLFTHPYFTSEKYMNTLDIKKRTAQRDLQILIEANVIEKVSQNKRTYYRNIQLYQLLENSYDI